MLSLLFLLPLCYVVDVAVTDVVIVVAIVVAVVVVVVFVATKGAGLSVFGGGDFRLSFGGDIF